MAHHKSVQKRVRQSEKQRMRNRAYLSSLRTSLKKLDLGIEGRLAGKVESEELIKMFRCSQSQLMKCVTKKRVKKNNASRKIKRLARRVKAACMV